MRLLRVIGGVDRAFGGPAASSVASCRAVARAGVDCTVAFPVDARSRRDGTAAAQSLSAQGARVRMFEHHGHFHRRARRWAVSIPMAIWLLRNARRYDVIHAHGAWQGTTLAALVGARLAGRPTVLTPHETLTRFDTRKSRRPVATMKRGLRLLYLHVVDLFVFSSELEQRESLHGARVNASVVLPHPVDSVGTSAQQCATGPRLLRVGFLGRFDSKKNLSVLLEAVAGSPGIELTIAGSGESDAEFRQRAAALGLDGRVSWLGFVSDNEKESFFASIDLLAMPSAFECFGMAAAEALARGVPVLVSPNTGIAEIVERHACGVVVAPEPTLISRQLQSLRGEPGALDTLGARAGGAAEELSPARHGERLRSEYGWLMANSRRVCVPGPSRAASRTQ